MARRSRTAGIIMVLLAGVSRAPAATMLTKPTLALSNYAHAVEQQNVKWAANCVFSHGRWETAVVRFRLAETVAQEELSKIAVRKLGPPADTASVSMAMVSTSFKTMGIRLKTAIVKIQANQATITLSATSGPQPQPQVKIYLTKFGATWKINGPKLFDIPTATTRSQGTSMQWIESSKNTIMVYDAAAKDLLSGKVKTWPGLHKDLQKIRMVQEMRRLLRSRINAQ